MKNTKAGSALVPVAGIVACDHLLRGQKVMLDADLARLYGVKTKALNKAVKRNRERFPADFMFQLARRELASLRFQIGTASKRNIRFLPYALTQEGIAMLSSVLRSSRAVLINIVIMRAFFWMRGFPASQNELARRLEELEKKHKSHSAAIQEFFLVIRKLMLPPRPARPPKREIGFHPSIARPA